MDLHPEPGSVATASHLGAGRQRGESPGLCAKDVTPSRDVAWDV